MTCDDMMTQEGGGGKGLMTKYPLFTEILDMLTRGGGGEGLNTLHK